MAWVAVGLALLASGCAQDGRSPDRTPISAAGTEGPASPPSTSTSRPVVEVPSPTVTEETATGEGEAGSATAVESPTLSETDGGTQIDDPAEGLDDEAPPGPSESTSPEASDPFPWLIQRRLGPEPTGCGSPFVLPGESVGLSAGGFAPHSEVSFTARGIAVTGTELPPPTIPPTTADGEGLIDVVWAVPEVPPAGEDPEPRAYIVEAAGIELDGNEYVAYMVDPLVAYPGGTICAVADSAATTLGQPVRIPVLDNDIAPEGGSLDPASVYPRPIAGGEFTTDTGDGSLTFTPDPGFAGTATGTYLVYDNWQIGVEGEITVTVDAGCTIDIPPDAREV